MQLFDSFSVFRSIFPQCACIFWVAVACYTFRSQNPWVIPSACVFLRATNESALMTSSPSFCGLCTADTTMKLSLPRFRPYLFLATKLTRDFTSEFLRFLRGCEFMRFHVVAFVSELHHVPKSRTTEMKFAKKKNAEWHREREGGREIHTHISPLSAQL